MLMAQSISVLSLGCSVSDAVPTANMGKLREKGLDKQTPVSIIVSEVASGVAAKT